MTRHHYEFTPMHVKLLLTMIKRERQRIKDEQSRARTWNVARPAETAAWLVELDEIEAELEKHLDV